MNSRLNLHTLPIDAHCGMSRTRGARVGVERFVRSGASPSRHVSGATRRVCLLSASLMLSFFVAGCSSDDGDSNPALDGGATDVVAADVVSDAGAVDDADAPTDTSSDADGLDTEQDLAGDDASSEDAIADDVADGTDAADDDDAGTASGACINPDDEAILSSTDFWSIFVTTNTTCGECLRTPPWDVCTGECVAEETGLSGECGYCHGRVMICAAERSCTECATPEPGPECQECVVERCGDEFRECSGLSIPPLE